MHAFYSSRRFVASSFFSFLFFFYHTGVHMRTFMLLIFDMYAEINVALDLIWFFFLFHKTFCFHFVLSPSLIRFSRNMSTEMSTVKQRFTFNHLPKLKPINEQPTVQSPVQQQRLLTLRMSPRLPPISRSSKSESGTATSMTTASERNSDTLLSPVNSSSTVLQEVDRFLQHHDGSSSIVVGATPNQAMPYCTKRTSLYSHVQSKINTGKPRTHTFNRSDVDRHKLGPSRRLNWFTLKQELQHDTQVRAQAKRLVFNSGITYAVQLKELVSLIRDKAKACITSIVGAEHERYKVVVHLTVFEAYTSGLYVASRCLWNTRTDDSITIQMQGVDCNILIVVFVCYTDLGAT
jgi:hypothetical protein